MRSLGTRFFATGVVALLLGMGWGIQMSASHDHLLAPAHGHLNLIGFVLMAVFGVYYALTPLAAASKLGELHYWLHLAAVIVLAPGIAMAIMERTEALAQIGSMLALVSGLLFLWIVLRFGLGEAGRGAAAPAAGQPAE